MERFEHGGDTYGMGDVLDFSSSLNPLGMPAQSVRALREKADSFSAYPDPHCRDLASAIAQGCSVAADQVSVTAGASDALDRIARVIKPRKALVCSPAYSGYEWVLRQLPCRILHHSLVAREDFDVTERILDYIEPDVDAVFLASPNNPTGRVLSRELLCKVLRTCDRWGARVVLDESFLALTNEHSAVSLLDRYGNLIVVNAFTKTYAMAGLRLGYCVCAEPGLARALTRAGAPWAVSAPAQVAGCAALDAPGYLELAREYIERERRRLVEGLTSYGMMVVPSQANFVLFQSPMPLYDELLRRGVLVRCCDNFRGLDATWFRVAVRTSDDNERLLAALGDLTGGVAR